MNTHKKTYLFIICALLLSLFAFSACAGGSDQDKEELGKQVFTQKCASCHSLEAEQIIVGPSLAHIATTAEGRLADKSAREYVEAMLVDSNTFDLEGFPNIMPVNMKGQVSAEEYEALVNFLMTQE